MTRKITSAAFALSYVINTTAFKEIYGDFF